MTDFSLETERIRLKTITPAIIHSLFETKQQAEIMLELGVDERGYEKYKVMHSTGIETYRTTMLFFLLINKETNKIIGECGYHTWYRDHNRAEVFYKLTDDSDKRKGYLSEVLPFVLNYGFNVMKLHRIEALVANWNAPSVKLLQKNNFQFEGTLKEHYLVDGVFEDSDSYALIKKQS